MKLFVDLGSGGNVHDDHDQLVVVDLVDDAVLTDPESPRRWIESGQHERPRRAGLVGQRPQDDLDPLVAAGIALADPPQSSFSPFCESDLVHRAFRWK